ncbi:MAG: hypothetical protein WAK16_02965 [Candidatus Cybelea sp.]|jgi:hypothetical protein
MKRFGLLLFIALALLCGARAYAQEAPATPTPDPHVYTDAAMTYTAPADAILLNRISVGVNQLGEDLQPVASWILRPGKEDSRTIQIAMEAYTGPPDQWEGQFESQTHGSQEGTLIRNKTRISLLNGMPAYFVEVAFGSGFDARKEYVVLWADGQRGIALAEITRMGDTSPEQAQEVLKQVTAVAYPLYQP